MRHPVMLASLSLIGTIVGAGIFGVPYVFARAGAPVGLAYCAVLGGTALLSHWYYSRICLAVPGKHRLIGYARLVLGKKAGAVAAVANPLGLAGSILAYYILGGSFLSVLLGGSGFVWTAVFFAAMALIMVLPFRKLLKYEDFFTWLLIAAAVAIVAVVAPHVKAENLMQFNRESVFLPFGIIFFSLGGVSVIPDMAETVRRNGRRLTQAVVIGTLASVAITAAFGLAVSGASGAATSENAISGLVPIVGQFIVSLGAIFGFLAIVTSFITAAANLKEQLNYDLKIGKGTSYALAVIVPYLAYLAGLRSFIGVIGFVGAVLGVIDGIILALIAARTVKSRLRFLALPLIVIFILGMGSEIAKLAK